MGAVFLDIEKAFDRIWHDGLIFKLSELKIPKYLGAWIKTYIRNRSFSVKVATSISNPKEIKAGCFQGSVLSPLLFNIYFNGIVKEIQDDSSLTRFALYADDLSLWAASVRIPSINKNLNIALAKIRKYIMKWRMKVSSEKTVVTLFDKKGIHSAKNLSVKYGETQLNYVKNPRFLGITLDPMLNFNVNSDLVLTRSNRRLNMLRKIRGTNWGVSSNLLMITYKVLIRSIQDYATLTIPLLTETKRLQFEILQRKAIKIAHNIPPGTTCLEMLKIAKVDSVMDRSITQIDKYLKKSISSENSLIKIQLNSYVTNIELFEGKEDASTKPTLLGLLLINEKSSAQQYLFAIKK